MTFTGKHVALITQPKLSSGLGGYLAAAFQKMGNDVDIVDCLSSKWFKLWPVLKSARFSSDAMWKARWEHTLFSSWAWKRNSARNAKLLRNIQRPDTQVLVVAKEYYPHPVGQTSDYSIFILYTMKLSLADGVTPWLPPEDDRKAFLALETEFYRNAKNIFVGGAYVKSHLVEEYGVEPDRIVIAGGGVHPEYLNKPAEVIPSTFKNNLIFVGWDFGMKGGYHLLEAFAEARIQRPELTLTVVGPGLSQQIPQEGVIWKGQVHSKDELIHLYRNSDLFVMPSLRDSFGYVFLEAMTQGVPCIGVHLNAMPEIIQDGKTGYIVPLCDPDALADAILRFYADSSNRQRMGQAAQQRVLEHYTWERVAATMWPYL